MSLPDLMLKCLRAAGVDPATTPVTWSMEISDGSISGTVCWSLAPQDSNAGKPQPFSKSKAGSPQFPTGKPQSSSLHSAGTPQLSTLHFPTSNNTPSGRRLYEPPTKKRKTPSQRRHSAKRRELWRLSRSSPADVLMQNNSANASDVSQELNSDSCPSSPVTDVLRKNIINNASDVSQKLVSDDTSSIVESMDNVPDSVVAECSVDESDSDDEFESLPWSDPRHPGHDAYLLRQSYDTVIDLPPSDPPRAPDKPPREKVPTYEVSDSDPAVYYRSFDDSDSDDDDLPLSDPRHPAHLWYQEFLAKQALV